MKKYYVLMIILMIAPCIGFCEIKNGYEREIDETRAKLRYYYGLQRDERLDPGQRRKLKASISSLVNTISYHELTDHLLFQFRLISPALYSKMDTLRDIQGRATDVYVKFVPPAESEIMAAGTTTIAQVADDRHMPCSEYGQQTVSVKIWIFPQALYALSHEFGHVNHMVPNLALYFEYYRTNYHKGQIGPFSLGHQTDDRSGKDAYTFQKIFHKDFVTHGRDVAARLRKPFAIVSDLKKKILDALILSDPIAVL